MVTSLDDSQPTLEPYWVHSTAVKLFELLQQEASGIAELEPSLQPMVEMVAHMIVSQWQGRMIPPCELGCATPCPPYVLLPSPDSGSTLVTSKNTK